MTINQSFQNWTLITDEPGEELVFEHEDPETGQKDRFVLTEEAGLGSEMDPSSAVWAENFRTTVYCADATDLETKLSENGSDTRYVVDQGTFESDSQILLDGLSNFSVIGAGKGRTVFTLSDSGAESSVFRVNNCSNFTLRDFSTDGNGSNHGSDSTRTRGVFCDDSCSEYDLVDIESIDAYGHGIAVGGSDFRVIRPTVTDFNTGGNSEDGITIRAEADTWDIINPDITYTLPVTGANAGVEPNDGASNGVIRGGRIDGVGIRYNSHIGEPVGEDILVADVTITDGDVVINGLSGTHLPDVRLDGVSIENGTLELEYVKDPVVDVDIEIGNNSTRPITIQTCSGSPEISGKIEYTGDSTTEPSEMVLVSATPKSNISVDIDAGAAGIDIIDGILFRNGTRINNGHVHDCTIDGVRRGVRVDGLDWVKVSDCKLLNTDRAVRVDDGAHNRVLDCEIINASRGLYTTGSADENNFESNWVEDVTTLTDLAGAGDIVQDNQSFSSP